MKHLIFLFLNLFLFFSCSTFKENSKIDKEKIIYNVPDTVQIWFNNIIEDPDYKSKKDNFYFIISPSFENNNRLFYDLILCDSQELENIDGFFVKNTNHYIYIKGYLYPLLNDLDQIFSTRDYSNKQLLSLLENREKIEYYYVIYEKTFWVKFDNKWGDIITTSDESTGGYKTNSPNKK